MTLLVCVKAVSQTGTNNYFTDKEIIGIDRDLQKLDYYEDVVIPDLKSNINDFKKVIESKDKTIANAEKLISEKDKEVSATNELLNLSEENFKRMEKSFNIRYKIVKDDSDAKTILIEQFPKELDKAYKDGHNKGFWKGVKTGGIVGIGITIIGGLLIF